MTFVGLIASGGSRSWWQQLFGDPLASFTALLAFATVALGAFAGLQSFVAQRTRVDTASPRVALSVGNVGWLPHFAQSNPIVASEKPDLAWVKWSDTPEVPSVDVGAFWAVHTVGRIRNDGASTAYVTLEIVGSDDTPRWNYSGEHDPDSPMFRVSNREFTLSPGEQVELDMYPGLPAHLWRHGDTVDIRWRCVVTSRLPTRVIDTCDVVWQLRRPFDQAANRLTQDPERSASVTGWTRRYRRWR